MATTGPDNAAPYGQFVDWEKRLTREAPFFERLLGADDIRRVIDVGAGSARHAIMFATWGLDVVAVDPSESMLDEARANLEHFAADIERGGGGVELVEGGFGDLGARGLGPADALVCTGNALPHVDGIEGLRGALQDFSAVLRPGGVAVVHLLNHARLLDERVRTISPKVRETPDGTRAFVRIMDYPPDGSAIEMSFITLTRPPGGEWTMDARASRHTALPFTLLAEELRTAGFVDIEALGDHAGTAFDAGTHESVIVVAHRQAG